MADPLATINTRRTPQAQPARPDQVRNNAGGHVFTVSDDTRVHRFLTLGVQSGTYYVSEPDLTADNAEIILRAARDRGSWLVEQVVAVSGAGRAPRQKPGIFALAAVAGLGDDDARRAALAALPAVCRTGTTQMQFAQYVQQFRGWGRGLRRAVAGLYTAPPVEDVAYQAVKYRQRDGWAQRDLIRLAHPETTDPARRALLNWITTGAVETSRGAQAEPRPVGATPQDLPLLVHAFEQAQATTRVPTWVKLIGEQPLSWEMLPDAALTEPKVWTALVERGMPQTALMRQLPRLTRLNVFDNRSILARVCEQLADPDRLRKARVHPVNVLVAARTYASGQSVRGSSTWTPVPKIIDALDAAFYASFGAVTPAGKRTLVALDVSGSMGSAAGDLPISCREASVALALVTAATEPHTDIVGFAAGHGIGRRGGWGIPNAAIAVLPISARQRLDDAVRVVSNLPFGGTDCALPITWAASRNVEYDTFLILTDNETWAGEIHVHQAIQAYRETYVPEARVCVAAMTPTPFSIADPTDAGMLDVVGLDAAVPNLIADFSRGDI